MPIEPGVDGITVARSIAAVIAIAALVETGIPQANCTATAVATSVDFRAKTRASGQPHALMTKGANKVICARRNWATRLVSGGEEDFGLMKFMPAVTVSTNVATATDKASQFAPRNVDNGSKNSANPTTRILPMPVRSWSSA